MNKPLDKFRDLLRELFQFDCADLDFGIYRIMNHKRDVIERFITQDLPKAVAEELGRGALAEQSQTAGELKEIAVQIKQTLGADEVFTNGDSFSPDSRALDPIFKARMFAPMGA
jgi:adenine-specific DNA-methyltransferase